MEMEFRVEFTESGDRSLVVRGKRSKRPRPCSPVGASSSTGGKGGGGGDTSYYSIHSPANSSDVSTNTEEDEDMANCLIMLAQSVTPIKHEEDKADKANDHRQKTEKLSSRRFAEMTATSVTAKSGIYVYECKTCNRAFPTFQALGGHRASHKRPKPLPATEDETKKKEVQVEQHRLLFDCESPPPGFLSNKSKVHECSICGAEFLSGQALGGHMRRHRTIVSTSSIAETAMNNIPIATTTERSRNVLSLDLNLPAPEEEFNFQFTSNNLVFSTPTLVDCHY